MYTHEIVTRIRIDTIDAILNERKPVLVACLRVDIDYQDIREEIETVAFFAGPGLRVCLALEDLLPYFEKRFSVSGTPTYLIIREGVLLDSILGKIPAQCLVAFVRPYVPEIPRIDGGAGAERAKLRAHL
jgi:hypothetical protein